MSGFEPRNPDFETHIRQAFADQGLMRSFGAELTGVAPGRITVEQDFGDHLLQQHGGLHGGAIAALLDTACGFAAVTLLPAGKGITTIEFKTNFLSAGLGTRFRASAEVLKPGRSIIVAEGRLWSLREGGEKLIASMTATMMVIDLQG